MSFRCFLRTDTCNVRIGSEQDVTCWLGVEFARDGSSFDVDLLGFNGAHVYCFECKTNASTLQDSQLDKLIGFARSVDARPGIAALGGSCRLDSAD